MLLGIISSSQDLIIFLWTYLEHETSICMISTLLHLKKKKGVFSCVVTAKETSNFFITKASMVTMDLTHLIKSPTFILHAQTSPKRRVLQ